MRRSEMFEPPKIEPLEPRRLFSNFSPAQIETAYGFSGITFNNGAITANGAGQTIALIETDNDTSIGSDLATFDTIFQIPSPPTLTIEGESGPTLPSNTAAGSSLYETALDVEWAHALAPAANIVVVEANSGSDSDLDAAVLQATSNLSVTVVSTSYTRPEVPYDYYSAPGTYSTPDGHTGITFVAAAGDAAETMHPAAYSGVVGVGGTSLTLNSNNTYNTETVWSQTGGGPSTIFSEPAYQEGVQQSGWRETPDVAFDADPNTGLDVVAGGNGYIVGGTSAGAPAWAALFALADQGRELNQLGTLDSLSQTLPMLYALANTPFYSQAFNDITSGSNGVYYACPGYDQVTGLGSPQAGFLVQYLAGNISLPEPATAAIMLGAGVLIMKRPRNKRENSGQSPRFL
jgi:subtilase family serine protease